MGNLVLQLENSSFQIYGVTVREDASPVVDHEQRDYLGVGSG